MTRTQLRSARTNLIVAGLIAWGLTLISGLIYAPGAIWRFVVWTMLAAAAVTVLVVLGQLLYAVVSLEKGYVSGDEASSRPTASAPKLSESEPIPVLPKPAMSVARSTQFDEALADLRAAQYLLSKVQASAAFHEFSETQRRECDRALEDVRAVLGNVERDKAIRRFAS